MPRLPSPLANEIRKHHQNANFKKLLAALPTELAREIRKRVPPPGRIGDMNCGKFISTMTNRYDTLDDYIEDLRKSVIRTLERVDTILKPTHYLRNATMSRDHPPLWNRPHNAISQAQKAKTADELVSICRQIVSWKHEAATIMTKLRALARYMEQYIETGAKRATSATGSLRLYPMSRFLYFDEFDTLDRNDPYQRDRLTREFHLMKANMKDDEASFAVLSAPIETVAEVKNCGIYIKNNRINKNSAMTKDDFQTFRNMVLMTLTNFRGSLYLTKFIRASALVDPGSSDLPSSTIPMGERVHQAILKAEKLSHKDPESVTTLIRLCSLVVDMKTESTLIVDRLKAFSDAMSKYMRTGRDRTNILKKLQGIASSDNDLLLYIEVPLFHWKKDAVLISRLYSSFSQHLANDTRQLKTLQQSIDVRGVRV